MAELDKFVPIEELAKHFVVSVSTVRSWVRQGHIPKETYLKIGNTYRFNLSKVVDALTGRHADEPIVVPKKDTKKQNKEPQQLELDFSNPDEDA